MMKLLILCALISLSVSSRRLLNDEDPTEGYGSWSKQNSHFQLQYVKAVVSCRRGQIKMWYGNEDTVLPYGWRRCDGKQKTPDLRGRFLVGAGKKHPYWSYGGQSWVKLTVDQLPAHKHAIWEKDMTVSSNGWHKHDAKGDAKQAGKHKHQYGTLSASENGAHSHNFWASSSNPDGGHDHNYSLVNDMSEEHKHDIDFYSQKAGAHTHEDGLTVEEGGSHGHTIYVKVEDPTSDYKNTFDCEDIQLNIPDHYHGVGWYKVSTIEDTHDHDLSNETETGEAGKHKHELNVMTEKDGGHYHEYDLNTDEDGEHSHGSGSLETLGSGDHTHLIDEIMIETKNKKYGYGDSNSGYGYGDSNSGGSYGDSDSSNSGGYGDSDSSSSNSDYGLPGYYECAWNTDPNDCQIGIALDKVDITHKSIIGLPIPYQEVGNISYYTETAGWHTHKMEGNTDEDGQHSHTVWGTITSETKGKHKHTISGKWTEFDDGHDHMVYGETDEYELKVTPTLSGESEEEGGYTATIPVNGKAWGGKHTHSATAYTDYKDPDDGKHSHWLTGYIKKNGTHNHRVYNWTNEDQGHTHKISGTIGDKDDGKHVHSFYGETGAVDGHSHDIKGYTASDPGHEHVLELDIEFDGSHDHKMNGQTGNVGGNQPIDITPSYFSVFYICCINDNSASFSYDSPEDLDMPSTTDYDDPYGNGGSYIDSEYVGETKV